MSSTRYEGFSDFVRARTQALSRTAFLLACDHGAAEDLLQTALAKTALHWPKVQAGNPEAYVRKALYHEHISVWRRRSRRLREVLTPGGEESRTDDRADEVATRLSVMKALATLPPAQRAVVVLRFYEDLTEVQTAQVLGIRLGTVKSQTRDALAKLRASAPELSTLHGNPVGPVEVLVNEVTS